jgi:hypothetical protein
MVILIISIFVVINTVIFHVVSFVIATITITIVSFNNIFNITEIFFVNIIFKVLFIIFIIIFKKFTIIITPITINKIILTYVLLFFLLLEGTSFTSLSSNVFLKVKPWLKFVTRNKS